LADKWKITVLPNLSLLVAGRGTPSIQTHRQPTVAAIGLSYDAGSSNPFNKPPLSNAVPEVQAIAKMFGVAPIMNADATEEALEREMTRAQYIHLAVHGERNIEAAAFHCLYLAPGENSDGMLCAHEVLRWDLRGVDLITMSACDSGLGRFDEGDNLRGLPASFLLAGASTVVGALWEVDDEASKLFFCEFYEHLRSQVSKMEAFTAAQAKTREKFARYADWGAFYLAGDWQ
jgi:CHAT domain-containing protein